IALDELAFLARDVRDYDPLSALDGGSDGLEPYRLIIPALSALLAPGGFVALEIGESQGGPVSALVRAAGLGETGIKKDLAGHDRVVFAAGSTRPDEFAARKCGALDPGSG
ncbi:MAG: hypothetical protein P4L76_11665, partial [Beijerinckiaceae bacterium]|nr:hypothetical protein [Beijerinckiaceae bacterium]